MRPRLCARRDGVRSGLLRLAARFVELPFRLYHRRFPYGFSQPPFGKLSFMSALDDRS